MLINLSEVGTGLMLLLIYEYNERLLELCLRGQ